MDGIANILGEKDFDVPREVQAIKDYVRRHYDQDVRVTLQQRTIIIVGRSAGLIATLRLQMVAIQEAAVTDKRLIFRIG